jgi:4-aminobutyrate aminotransferase/(S)-3-amino-2-methylpropionate transaminase
MTLTSRTSYKTGCGPFADGVYRLPFPDYFKNGGLSSPSEFVDAELRRFEELFVSYVSAEHVAAVIIEPIQGEGGFVPAPSPYLQGLRRICTERGIMLICDEVQTGFCRTGKWAAFEHSGIVPDISTWAKSMGGGMPISAVIGRAEVMDAARPGTLGGTFGGNPVACAAALAAIDSMESLNLNDRANEIGEIVRGRFEALAQRCDLIGDVRGIGAMIGLELSINRDPNCPASAEAAFVKNQCLDRGVVIMAAGSYGNVLRILSPLTISLEDLSRGLDIIEESVLSVSLGEA